MREGFLRSLVAGIVVATVAGAAWGGSGVWTSGGPEGGPVEALVIDPGSSATLYVATRHNAVFRSTDGAAGWTSAGTGLPRTVALAGHHRRRHAVGHR